MEYSDEFKQIVEVYEKAGGVEADLKDSATASLVINEDKVLGKIQVPGLKIDTEKIQDGVDVKITVEEGAEIKNPVHLCFGVLPQEGKQIIKSNFVVKKGAKVKFLSHCLFPNAVKVQHLMDSKMVLEKGASVSYVEEHFHPNECGITVKPFLRAELGEGAKLFDEFKIVKGQVGLVELDYEVSQSKDSVCDLLTKIYSKRDDEVKVREALFLNGANARGTAKSRIVLKDESKAIVFTEVEGNAAGAMGHVDCNEVIEGDKALAEAIPKIKVNHPDAKVTHEAAIGKINKKELETLMSRGLSKDEATDFIVKGLLD